MPSRWFRGATTLCLVWLATTASSARLPSEPLPRVKAMQQRILMEEPAGRAERLERFEKWYKRNRGAHPRQTKTGMRLRDEKRGDLSRARSVDFMSKAKTLSLSALTAPTNVLMNDTLEQDGTGQSEVSIAAFGNNLVAAWNDGIGLWPFPFTDSQGFAYSTDGGASWTDGGVPPTTNIGRWSSDPVVVVNEKTGAFYFCALTDQDAAGTNGIGVVKGTFSGASFNWGTPESAVEFDNSNALLDKQWMAVDSLTGNLYITYSHFVASGGQLVSDEIRFMRSTNDNQSWSAPVRVSRVSDDGFVQGSRVAVGPNGEIHLVWHAIGQANNSPYGRDYLRVRRSNDQGVNFAPEGTADSLFSNFMSGGPGFNRPIGITFPSIAVDRSRGINRGRVYLAWNEALNFYADLATLPECRPGGPCSPGLVETENNNGPSVADLFTPGVILRGVVSVPNDLDYWRWNATQGTTYFFWVDSLNQNLDASFRIFCSDGTSNLAFNQNGTGTSGGGELLLFTAPTSGTYYLRVASFSISFTGAYRVLTTVHTPHGADRARDHRDLFVKSSADGFTWGPTTRLNDSPGNFDDFLPEVAVDGFGRVFVAAYDWRDAPNCGGGSNVYLYRSDNGGASWVGGTRITDYTTDWTVTYTNMIPNQGDYIGLFAQDSTVYVTWADGRNQEPGNGDPDVYMARTNLNCTAAPVAGSGIVVNATRDTATVTWAAAAGTPATLFRRVGSGGFTNLGPVVADGLGQIVYVDTQVSAGNTYTYRLGVTGFCEVFAGEQAVTIPGLTGPLLAINDLRPNPSPGDIRVTFTLASSDKATLALYDISGRLIRSLDVTDQGPGGPHSVLLYSGNRLRSGIYFVQLSQGGHTKERRISVFP